MVFSLLRGPAGPTFGAPNTAGGSPPVITSPSSLVTGTVGTLYPTTTFTATGTAPITWSITSGTLPTGMSFSSGGVLSGTPTATASGSITFRATNAFGFADRPLTLTVNSASGPVLISAPTVASWPSTDPTNRVGTILVATQAVWQDQYPIELSGTVGAIRPGAGQIYIGDGVGPASSQLNTAGAFTGGNWFIVFSPGAVNTYDTGITAYDSTTKIATVSWPAGGNNPATGAQWKMLNRYPIQRRWRWLRNGVVIPNALGYVYTVQPADLGTTIQIQETAGFIPANTPSNVLVSPTVTNVTTSTPISITTAAVSSGIIGPDKFTYIGSFRAPMGAANSAKNMSVRPVGSNGQPTLLINDDNSPSVRVMECSIPADGALGNPTTVPNPLSLPFSTALQSVPTPYDPVGPDMGVNGVNDGINPGGNNLMYPGSFVLSSTEFVFGGTSSYSNDITGLLYLGNPATLSSPSVTGPVNLLDTPRTGGVFDRDLNSKGAISGGASIPSTWQAALGGDTLFSNPSTSVISSQSRSPALFAVSSSTIRSAAAKSESGALRAATSTTIQLAAGATGTTSNYYDGFAISVNGILGLIYVQSYDPATKTITVPVMASVPTVGTTYKLVPPAYGRGLTWSTGDPATINGIPVPNQIYDWVTSGQSACMFPNGTNSAVSIGGSSTGPIAYGINGLPTAAEGTYIRIYDPVTPAGTGQHVFSGENPGLRFWVFDANTLASVVSGAIDQRNVAPAAVFSMPIPYEDKLFSGAYGAGGYTFDSSTNRFYSMQLISQNFALRGIVHVYQFAV